MRALGYIIDKKTGDKILLLVSQSSYYRNLKLRKSGKDGVHFTDEEAFLNSPTESDRFEELKKGIPISC